jgi:molecular chaperone HtpG
MYESSLINSGFSLDEPSAFVNRINRMIKLGLSLDDDNEIENTIEESLEEINDVEVEADESKMEEVD